MTTPLAAETFVAGLIEGTYKFKLVVDDNSHFSEDFVNIFVSDSDDLACPASWPGLALGV